jgi:L-proline amide hydrolase
VTEPVHEGVADFLGWQTWYRIAGDPSSDRTPLLVVHGGPGAAHNYLLRYADFADSGRAVIHYDQLGIGHSTHLRDKGADFWHVGLFLDELDNLLRHLGIQHRYHLLGQSWGGMLAAEHAVLQPPGLRSLVISNSPASIQLWLQEANKLRAKLPPEVQATLLRREADGTTNADEYSAAVRVFYDRHVCRVPWPPEVEATFAAIADNPTVYHTMNGPSEFHCIGTIRTWSIIDRLNRIQAPTLLISGRYDEATEAVVQPFADHIANVRWAMFPNSSHMPHVEETAACLEVVEDFLAAHH